MCKVIMQMVDKVPADHPLRAVKYSRGDIIDVVNDDVELSQYVLNHPQWRVFQLVGIDRAQLSDMVAVIDDRQAGFFARRGRTVNLDAIPNIAAKLISGQVTVFNAGDGASLLAAKINKVNVANVVIG